MPFTLPKLPYKYNALLPTIDAETMELHHKKLHRKYVDNLNAALKDYPDLANKSASWLLHRNKKVPIAIRKKVKDNAGGYLNHLMFWQIMSPDGGGSPSGELSEQIKNDFGSFSDFKDKFNEAGENLVGSGWVWLIWREGKLVIETLPNQEHPLLKGELAIMGVDVFEHAYFLKYHTERASYLKAWWRVANWDMIEERFEKIKG